MNADNLKMVFLSGTPMINNLYEAGQLFNLLRRLLYCKMVWLTDFEITLLASLIISKSNKSYFTTLFFSCQS